MFVYVSFAVQCMRLFTSKDWIFSHAPVLAHERYREGCWCQTMLLNERTRIRELQFKVPLLCQAQFVALQNLALEWSCSRKSLWEEQAVASFQVGMEEKKTFDFWTNVRIWIHEIVQLWVHLVGFQRLPSLKCPGAIAMIHGRSLRHCSQGFYHLLGFFQAVHGVEIALIARNSFPNYRGVLRGLRPLFCCLVCGYWTDMYMI